MNPYEKDLDNRDPIAVLTTTPERFRQLLGGMRDEDLAQPYGPGKWNAAQIFAHLVQCELVFAMRIRMALTEPAYVVQPFDQDKFMAREPGHDGREAFEVYLALRRWNLPLYKSVTPEERTRAFTHPERGRMVVGDVIDTLAGHDLHHLPQIEAIAKSSRR